VTTYINRPGGPPFAPFTPEEMQRARVFAGVVGVLMRHLGQQRGLAAAAVHDLREALGELAPAGADSGDRAPITWLRVLQQLEGLSEEEQGRCVELLELVGRWWKQDR
jgi:hypothetical protein